MLFPHTPGLDALSSVLRTGDRSTRKGRFCLQRFCPALISLDGSRRVGQEGDVTSPLDGHGDHPLMLGAVSGNPARDNLAALRGEQPQSPRVLIVNHQAAVRTVATNLSPVIGHFTSAFIHHGRSPLSRVGFPDPEPWPRSGWALPAARPALSSSLFLSGSIPGDRRPRQS
jgi:hypothetical protein